MEQRVLEKKKACLFLDNTIQDMRQTAPVVLKADTSVVSSIVYIKATGYNIGDLRLSNIQIAENMATIGIWDLKHELGIAVEGVQLSSGVTHISVMIKRKELDMPFVYYRVDIGVENIDTSIFPAIDLCRFNVEMPEVSCDEVTNLKKGISVSQKGGIYNKAPYGIASELYKVKKGDVILLSSSVFEQGVTSKIAIYCSVLYDTRMNFVRNIVEEAIGKMVEYEVEADGFVRVSAVDNNEYQCVIVRYSNINDDNIELTKQHCDRPYYSIGKVDVYNGVQKDVTTCNYPDLSDRRVTKHEYYLLNYQDANFVIHRSYQYLAYIDNRGTMYFWGSSETNGIGIISYSKDGGKTLLPLKDNIATMNQQNWWKPYIHCMTVLDNGTILYSAPEQIVGVGTVRALYAIEGWEDGYIKDGKDGNGNLVTFGKKFMFSSESFVADRTDIPSIPVGNTILGYGRLMPGWNMAHHNNIVFISEYGAGTSRWTYLNRIRPDGTGGNNGLGINYHAWISFDYGKTFKCCFSARKTKADGSFAHLSDPETIHIHASCYDPYSRRFYLVTGDAARGAHEVGWNEKMVNNQSILMLPLEEMKAYYSRMSSVNSSENPNVYNDGTPVWNRCATSHIYSETTGESSAWWQFSGVYPRKKYLLLSSDHDVQQGLFRLVEDLADFSKSYVELHTNFEEKDLESTGRAYFSGPSMSVPANLDEPILSMVKHDNNGKSMLASNDDIYGATIIYRDINGYIGWGAQIFKLGNKLHITSGVEKGLSIEI